MAEEEGKDLIEKTFEELAREYLGDAVGSGTDDVDLDDLADKYLSDFDVTPDSALKTYSSDWSKPMSEEPVSRLSSSELTEDAAVTLGLPTALDSPNKRKSPGSPSSSGSKQRKTEILGMKDEAEEELGTTVSPTEASTNNSNVAPETKGTTSLTHEGDKHEITKQVGKKHLSGRPEANSRGLRFRNDTRNQRDRYSRNADSRYTRSGQREQGTRGLLGHCPPSHNDKARPENQNRNGPRGASHDHSTSRRNGDRLAFDANCKGGPLGEKRETGRTNFEHPFQDKFGNSDRRKPHHRTALHRNEYVPSDLYRRDGLLDPPSEPSFNRDENSRRNGLLDPPQPSFDRDENSWRNGLLDPPPQPSFNRDEKLRRDGLLEPPQPPFGRDDNIHRDGLLDPPQPLFNRDENIRRDGPFDAQVFYSRDEMCRRNGPVDPTQRPFNRDENFQRDGLLDPPQESLNWNENFRRDALLNPPQPPFSRDENFRRDGLLDPPRESLSRDENFRRDHLLDHPRPPFNMDENFRREGLLDPPQKSLNKNHNFRRDALLDLPQPPFNRDENFCRDALLDPPRESFNREENFRRNHLLDRPKPPFKDGLLDIPQPPCNRDENFRRDGLLDPPLESFNRNENFRREGLLDPPQTSFQRDENYRRDALLDPPCEVLNRNENFRRDAPLDHHQPPFDRDGNFQRAGLLNHPQQLFVRSKNFRRDGMVDPPQESFNRDENIRRDGLLDPPQPPFNRDENVQRDGLLDPPQLPFSRDENIRRDGLLDPPQPPFSRNETIRRDGLLDPPQPPFNRDENVWRDGLLDPPRPPFNRNENVRRDGLLDHPQPPFSMNENFQRDGLLDPPQLPFNMDQNFRRDGLLDLQLNRDENIMRDGLLDHTQPPLKRDDNFRKGGLLDPPHPSLSLDENMQPHLVASTLYQTFPWDENMQAMLVNRNQLDTPHPPITYDENDRGDAQLDPLPPTLSRGESQRDGLLPLPLPVFSGDEPTPNRRGLLDPPNTMTLNRDMSHFDNRCNDNVHGVCTSQPKPPLSRGEVGQSVNQGPQPEHGIDSPSASCSVQAKHGKDARKPRALRRGVSVHEFVTKVVLTTFSTTRSATLTAGKYSVPSSCKSAVPPEINFELLKKLPRSIRKANTVLLDCQQWLARGMAPLITQVNMFGKEPQTSAEVCRRTTDSLRILACTSVNISKGRRLLMRCHLPEKYGILCRMSNSVTSSLFGDKVDEDIRSIEMGTSKVKMLNGPNEETHIPKVTTDLLRDENIDENVASMVNMACTKEGIVKNLREKYKIPSNLNCMIPPKLNPEISSMLPVTCVDLDTKLQDVQLSTSEAMVPGIYLMERIHEKMYNDNEAVKMLTDALALLGDAMFQYNNLRMELFKENLPLQLQQECVWSSTENESVVPDCEK